MRFNSIRYKNNLDEFTFEGRNKSYGAYVLRRAYENRIFVAIIFVCLITIISTISYKVYLNNYEEAPEREIDLSKYEGFDLRLSKNILPELPKGEIAKPKEKPKKADKPKKQPDKPKDVVKDQIKKSNKLDFTKISDKIVDTLKIDTLAKNGLSIKDSISAAIADAKRLDSLEGLKGKANSMMLNNRLGGIEEFIAWVQQNFVYPKTNRLQFDCTINVYFCINDDGTLSDVKIIKEVTNKEYNQEVLRVVKSSPIWKVENNGIKSPCVPKQVPIRIHAKI